MLKRVTGLTVAATLTLSAPFSPNIVNVLDTNHVLGTSIVHAASENLMEPNEISTYFASFHNDYYGYTRHILFNGGSPISLEGLDSLKYVVKFPDELAYLLDDPFMIDILTDLDSSASFMVTGHV